MRPPRTNQISACQRTQSLDVSVGVAGLRLESAGFLGSGLAASVSTWPFVSAGVVTALERWPESVA